MNSVLETLDPLARLLVQALLNSVWQGVLIAALVWLLLRMIGRVSATTRHALWLVSLLTIGFLPLLGLLSPRLGAFSLLKRAPTAEKRFPAHQVTVTAQAPPHLPDRLPQPQAQMPRPASQFNFTTAPTKQGKFAMSLQAARAPGDGQSGGSAELTVTARALVDETVSAPPLTPQTWSLLSNGGLLMRPSQWLSHKFKGRAPLLLAAFWLLVAAGLGGRIAHSYWYLFRLRRRLTPAPDIFNHRMHYLAGRFDLRRHVGLFTATSVKMPMTIGWLRPLIVLPPDLLESLSTAECDSVMAHELAHIKRWDYATNFFQRTTQAVLFFHPAVWFINKQLVIERELACDDWAVKLTGEPRRYASCLTKLVELLSESKPLAAATGILFGKHIISRRVEMVLNRDRNATTSVSKPALVYAIGLAFLFVFVFSTLSPVIAVPLAQQAAKKAQEAKPAAPPKVVTPAVPSTPAPAVAPALLDEVPPLARIEIDGEEIAIPAFPALVEVPDVSVVWQDLERFAPLAPVQPMPPAAWGVASTFPAPALAPGAPLGWAQSGTAQSKTPAIPETELLGLLSDIVKKDADENVRREALQGIYRMRSDAAVNTLIQLYDSASDVKMKSEILGYLMRRNGDNSKATAKLVQIAKTEKNEDLLRVALNQLAYVKGDEGADHLVSIYDGLQDPKLKQRVVRALAVNKSKKAIDKLMSIAKNDSDPTVRQAAIRSIYGIDNQLYLNFAEGRTGLLTVPEIKRAPGVRVVPKVELDRLRELKEFNFDFDAKSFELDQEAKQRWQSETRAAQERAREHLRESQERLRDEYRLVTPRARKLTPESPESPEPNAAPTPKAAPEPKKDEKSSEKTPAKLKPATYRAVVI
jgi:beta-lactamase regulating signal transducer with metallopeptidase domain